MKKKIFILIMLLALIATMMPLSVFANSNNEPVITKLGESGLYLVGDREAVQSTDEYSLDGDYFVSDDVFKFVDIDAPGWTLIGEDSEYHVFISEMEGGAEVTLGNLSIPRLEVTDETSTGITVPESSEVNITDILYLMGQTILNGNGKINVEYQGVTSDKNSSLIVNGVTLNVNKTYGVGPAMLIDGDMTINYGKVIAVNEVEGEMRAGLSCFGSLKVEDSAELFAIGDNYGVLFGQNSKIDSSKYVGNASKIPYEEKDQVNVPVRETPVTIGTRDLNAFEVADENATFASTIYHQEVLPTTYQVTFKYQDDVTPDLVEEVVEGDVVAKPENPTREGYTFDGWFCNAEGEGNAYDFSTPVNEDLILYAKWTQNEEPVPTPTPAPPVNPTNNGGTANTGDNAMPIIFITLGFAAGIVIFEATRRLRSK